MEIVNITNRCYDLGALVYYDSTSYQNLNEEELEAKAKQNTNKFFQAMFDYKKKQPEKRVLEFETPFYSVTLPPVEERLPRLVPPPKPKPLTKWEKFRKERGLAPRKRRERKVFDPVTKRWVRRFGYKSIKKLQESRTAVIVAKPGEEHIDPFEKMAVEKKFMLEKEKLKSLNNQMRAAGVNMKLLREKKGVYDKGSVERGPKKKREMKEKRKDREMLKNTLKNSQISTASMGIYDKKATKDEKNLGVRKKKMNVNLSATEEKERSLKFLKILKRKDEIKDGVINDDVIVRKRQKETETLRARARKHVKSS